MTPATCRDATACPPPAPRGARPGTPLSGAVQGTEPCSRQLWGTAGLGPCPGAYLALLLVALLLLVGIASGKEGPGHAADDGRHASTAGGRGVAPVEFEGAHGEVHLRPRTGHGVQAVVELLPLCEEPARREEP